MVAAMQMITSTVMIAAVAVIVVTTVINKVAI